MQSTVALGLTAGSIMPVLQSSATQDFSTSYLACTDGGPTYALMSALSRKAISGNFSILTMTSILKDTYGKHCVVSNRQLQGIMGQKPIAPVIFDVVRTNAL